VLPMILPVNHLVLLSGSDNHMRVMVVGAGAREHALVWKLKASPNVSHIFVAPGNGGTDKMATNLPIAVEDIDTLARAAVRFRVDLTVVGSEVPLSLGIVNKFQQSGLPIFGPSKESARLESSKAFARILMTKYGIPGPEYRIFNNYSDGYKFLSNHQGPLVVKADGLAAGKGAIVCVDQEASINALYDCMEEKVFGVAGSTVVVEEYLQGTEISVFAFSDGEQVSSLVVASDYKRLLDGNRGPNTGGMGSFTPVPEWRNDFASEVRSKVMMPVIEGMAEQGYPYKGVLYAGLMVKDNEFKVLEFNCRFGDPETQVLMPILESDLLDVLMSSVEGRLALKPVKWADRASVGVVIASRGYPGSYRKGQVINGLDQIDPSTLIFHAGTARDKEHPERLVTVGGRVLTVVSSADTLEEARGSVYENVGHIEFNGAHFRKDISYPYVEPIKKGVARKNG